MNTILYCFRQGLKNFIRNPLFSFASTVTVSACIFIFCIFTILAVNLGNVLEQAETNVGISVFFQDGCTEESKTAIREKILAFEGVREVKYISADEAWEEFRNSYFGSDAEELSRAFEGENPLSGSDSYEVFMDDIDLQSSMVSELRATSGVREVKYASSAVTFLKKINSWIYLFCILMISVLFAVSLFLISNTINVAAAFRKRENEIMKLIGARNYMIRLPFVIEGILIGLIGSLIPLVAVNVLYYRLSSWLEAQLQALTASALLREVFTPVPIAALKPFMIGSGLLLGLGMGALSSLFTINRHLRKMR